MKVSHVGLVGAGGVARSFLAQSPAVAERLGPVKASSYKVASRIVNAFRAGYPVADYSSLAGCTVILVAVPDTSLHSTITELSDAGLYRHTILLCNSLRDSLALEPLRVQGASVASVNAVEGSEDSRLVAEGDTAALRDARRLFAHRRTRLIELNRSSKALYLSALSMASHLLLPMVAGAVDSLRTAGVERAEATRLVEALVFRALRGYTKAGSRAWNASAAESRHQIISSQMETIREMNGGLAEFYAESASRAREFFRTARARAVSA